MNNPMIDARYVATLHVETRKNILECFAAVMFDKKQCRTIESVMSDVFYDDDTTKLHSAPGKRFFEWNAWKMVCQIVRNADCVVVEDLESIIQWTYGGRPDMAKIKLVNCAAEQNTKWLEAKNIVNYLDDKQITIGEMLEILKPSSTPLQLCTFLTAQYQKPNIAKDFYGQRCAVIRKKIDNSCPFDWLDWKL